MAIPSPVSESLYLSDLLEQPEALQRTLALPVSSGLADFSDRLNASDSPFVILTGMGSSYHALWTLAVRFAQSGIRALLLETSELLHYWSGLLQPKTLVIAVSQSGRSAEMVRLLEMNNNRASIVGVTNDPSSPLAMGADSVVLIDAGAEATVSCKTYTCTLLALSQVGEVLCRGDLSKWRAEAAALPGLVASYLSQWREHVEEVQNVLGDINHMVLVGRGPSLAAAGTGALIIKEAARFHAEGMSAAAFRHGPLEMVTDKLFVLVFRGDSRSAMLNERLARDVEAIGGKAAIVSDDSLHPVFRMSPAAGYFRPILEVLPAQIITLALAARTGKEAGSFVHVSKITSIE